MACEVLFTFLLAILPPEYNLNHHQLLSLFIGGMAVRIYSTLLYS